MQATSNDMATLSDISSGPLSLITSSLPKEDLQNFLLVSKTICKAGRESVATLRPNPTITDSQLGRICELFPFVETLDLRRCKNLVAPRLGYLPCLKVFFGPLYHSRSTAAGFLGAPRGFRSCPNLEELDMYSNQKLTGLALEGLESCQKLRKLKLEFCWELLNSVLATIGKLTGLRSLKMHGCTQLSAVI